MNEESITIPVGDVDETTHISVSPLDTENVSVVSYDGESEGASSRINISEKFDFVKAALAANSIEEFNQTTINILEQMYRDCRKQLNSDDLFLSSDLVLLNEFTCTEPDLYTIVCYILIHELIIALNTINNLEAVDCIQALLDELCQNVLEYLEIRPIESKIKEISFSFSSAGQEVLKMLSHQRITFILANQANPSTANSLQTNFARKIVDLNRQEDRNPLLLTDDPNILMNQYRSLMISYFESSNATIIGCIQVEKAKRVAAALIATLKNRFQQILLEPNSRHKLMLLCAEIQYISNLMQNNITRMADSDAVVMHNHYALICEKFLCTLLEECNKEEELKLIPRHTSLHLDPRQLSSKAEPRLIFSPRKPKISFVGFAVYTSQNLLKFRELPLQYNSNKQLFSVYLAFIDALQNYFTHLLNMLLLFRQLQQKTTTEKFSMLNDFTDSFSKIHIALDFLSPQSNANNRFIGAESASATNPHVISMNNLFNAIITPIIRSTLSNNNTKQDTRNDIDRKNETILLAQKGYQCSLQLQTSLAEYFFGDALRTLLRSIRYLESMYLACISSNNTAMDDPVEAFALDKVERIHMLTSFEHTVYFVNKNCEQKLTRTDGYSALGHSIDHHNISKKHFQDGIIEAMGYLPPTARQRVLLYVPADPSESRIEINTPRPVI
jgi:hypothetical protein